jgi:hypothetical protein
MTTPIDPDSSEAIMADVAVLEQAASILRRRFRLSGKHRGTAEQVRAAYNELISKARHPHRMGRVDTP